MTEAGESFRPRISAIRLSAQANPRRRLRSSSPDLTPSASETRTQGLSITEAESVSREDQNNEQGVGNSRSPLERPSPRKRRRLMSKTMRLDSEFSIQNGSRHQSNGAQYPTPRKNSFHSATNGRTSDVNGTSTIYRNGSSPSLARSHAPSFFGHDREEVTRLLIQGLTDLGYHGAADRLSQESGYVVESPSVADFRLAVLQGRWAEAESLLFGSPQTEDVGGVSISNGDSHEGLKFADGVDSDELKFRMREQKYLELLESRDLSSALKVLRQELTPLHQDIGKLHDLSRYVRETRDQWLLILYVMAMLILDSLIVCDSAEDLKTQARWDGAGGRSRQNLLQELSSRSETHLR